MKEEKVTGNQTFFSGNTVVTFKCQIAQHDILAYRLLYVVPGWFRRLLLEIVRRIVLKFCLLVFFRLLIKILFHQPK